MSRPFTGTTTDASGGATYSNFFQPDLYSNPFNLGFGVIVTGTVNYTVQHTFDDPNSASAVWLDHSSVAAKTASQDGNYAYPCRAVRLKQNSGNGSCRWTVIQAGGPSQ